MGFVCGWGYSCACTAVLILFIKATIGIRASETEEVAGMDISQHREVVYHFIEPETNSIRS